MTFSILHISDLHRDPSQGIGNGPLLQSLANDRNRYSNSPFPIPAPSLIVVSGDIVYGVPVNHPNATDALDQQYAEAESFLTGLADEFLDGDRDRLVLVPGNHDVSFPATFAALAPMNAHPPSSVFEPIADLFTPHSAHRWSWRELSLFRLSDQSCYNSRLECFCRLYERFYQRNRTYSLNPEQQFDIFSYPSLSVVVAAFNSCYNNDPLHRAGYIHPGAIAAAASQVASLRYHGYMPIAVWHHNTSGGPHSDDYMDPDALQVLIDCGFCIGLHGHQHKAAIVDERFRFESGRKITVISAGTLSGGAGSLPVGHDRSYNIIELNLANSSAVVHQRRMVNSTFAFSVWSEGWFPETNSSKASFSIQRPLHSVPSARARLAEAELLLADRRFEDAARVLFHICETSDTARQFLVECYQSLDYDARFVDAIFPPRTLAEAVIVADALWELHDLERLSELIRSEMISASMDPVAIEIRNNYEARLR